MIQLMTNSYPSTEENSSSFQIDEELEVTDNSELNIRTASIEDLSNLIVAEMISSVRKDIELIKEKMKKSSKK